MSILIDSMAEAEADAMMAELTPDGEMMPFLIGKGTAPKAILMAATVGISKVKMGRMVPKVREKEAPLPPQGMKTVTTITMAMEAVTMAKAA